MVIDSVEGFCNEYNEDVIIFPCGISRTVMYRIIPIFEIDDFVEYFVRFRMEENISAKDSMCACDVCVTVMETL